MTRVRLLAVAAALATAATLLPRPADAQPAQFASIKGQVVFPANKPIPERKPLTVNQDKQVCLKDGPILDESVIVDGKTRGIKNVVVWLRPDNTDPKKNAIPPNVIFPGAAQRKPADVVIDQPCCMFVARVTCARVGDTLVVKNPAPIAHNFFWISNANAQINITIAAGMQYRFPNPLQFEAGPIEYKCTIHPWMNGYVRVFDHPYYAVTDENGRFELKDCPVGKWRVVVWHEKVGFLGGKEGRFGRPVDVTPTGADMKAIEFDL